MPMGIESANQFTIQTAVVINSAEDEVNNNLRIQIHDPKYLPTDN